MLFNSLEFFIFFPLVVIFNFLLKQKFRWQFLLLASCYFYAAFVPVYLILVFFIISCSYFTGILLNKELIIPKKLTLALGITINVGTLILFKYYSFFHQNIDCLCTFFEWNNLIPEIKLLLPIGLSFHVFQAISYIIEVYYKRQNPEQHFGYFSLYIMYFPQLIAGPIERPQNTLHQFKEKYNIDTDKIRSGLLILFWGLFKKVVIADRLAMAVDFSYDNFDNQSSLSMTIASVFYSFQIYCDFSGYSDIAIGASRVLGIDLMKNFRSPYFSKSITEFWKRWHISLSSWFRDYLYIPLGGNKVSNTKLYFNLMIVFVVSGIWHGANWTFIVWGAIHGIILIIEKLIKALWIKENNIKNNFTSNIFQIGSQLLTFIIVTIAWVYFRSPNIQIANNVVKKLTSISIENSIDLSLNSIELCFSFILIIILMIVESEKLSGLIKTKKATLFFTIILATSCYFLGVFNEQQFIYFQF